jgi:haloacetate dehalogenase
MFEGFADRRIDVGEVDLHVRHAGDGPAVLLIHGHPRTGSTWHRVAPRLVELGFSVVCPDMRGYGCGAGGPAGRMAATRADLHRVSRRTAS